MAEIIDTHLVDDLEKAPGNEKRQNLTESDSMPSKDASLIDRSSGEGQKAARAWEKPGPLGSIRRCWRTVQRYIWYDPDKSKEEKFFLFKLDCFLLSYGCLGYFCKNLDQANLNNAYGSFCVLSISRLNSGSKGFNIYFEPNLDILHIGLELLELYLGLNRFHEDEC